MVESSSIEFMNVSLNMFATAGLGITRAASVKTEKFIKRLAWSLCALDFLVNPFYPQISFLAFMSFLGLTSSN